MEIAGSRLRARGLAPVRQHWRNCVLRRPASVSVARQQPRRLYAAGGSGPGPAGASSGDINDSLAPILFRFGDGPSSSAPTVSTNTSQGGAWAGVISAGTTSSATSTTASSSSASVLPLDAPPRTGTTNSTGTTTTSTSSPPTTSRLSHEAVAGGTDVRRPRGPDTTSSYADFYRKANTAFQRSQPAGSGGAAVLNGFSHSTPSPSPATVSADTTAAASPSPTTTAAEPRSPAASLPLASHTPSPTSTTSSTRPPPPTKASVTTSTISTPEPSSPEAPSQPHPQPQPDSDSDSDAVQVTAALARAQAALARAETSLDDIQRLSTSLDAAALESLRRGAPPTRWSRILSLVRSSVLLGGMAFAMLASHAFGLAVQWAGAVVGAVAIAGWGLRRGSLAPSGAAAAFLVGCGTLGSSLRFGATLVAFFLSSSKLTAYKEELKEGLEENAKKGGQRTWVQVLCNGLLPTILAVIYGILAGCVDLPLGPPTTAAAAATSAATAITALATGPPLEPWRAAALTGLMGGFLGYYSCCCGDTWASELGPLSADTPLLITTMRPVRRGTNGGVTLLGLSASIMGGMFVGLVFYLAGLLSPTLWIFESQRALATSQWRLIPLGLMAGLLGSVLDSVLGATLQYTGYDVRTGRIVSRPGPDVEHISGLRLLDNNAVNAVSATATAALTAFVALKSFGF